VAGFKGELGFYFPILRRFDAPPFTAHSEPGSDGSGCVGGGAGKTTFSRKQF
jgi:hypothetical protein